MLITVFYIIYCWTWYNFNHHLLAITIPKEFNQLILQVHVIVRFSNTRAICLRCRDNMSISYIDCHYNVQQCILEFADDRLNIQKKRVYASFPSYAYVRIIFQHFHRRIQTVLWQKGCPIMLKILVLLYLISLFKYKRVTKVNFQTLCTLTIYKSYVFNLQCIAIILNIAWTLR